MRVFSSVSLQILETFEFFWRFSLSKCKSAKNLNRKRANNSEILTNDTGNFFWHETNKNIQTVKLWPNSTSDNTEMRDDACSVRQNDAWSSDEIVNR